MIIVKKTTIIHSTTLYICNKSGSINSRFNYYSMIIKYTRFRINLEKNFRWIISTIKKARLIWVVWNGVKLKMIKRWMWRVRLTGSWNKLFLWHNCKQYQPLSSMKIMNMREHNFYIFNQPQLKACFVSKIH